MMPISGVFTKAFWRVTGILHGLIMMRSTVIPSCCPSPTLTLKHPQKVKKKTSSPNVKFSHSIEEFCQIGTQHCYRVWMFGWTQKHKIRYQMAKLFIKERVSFSLKSKFRQDLMNLLIFNLIWHISMWAWTLCVEIAGLSSLFMH